MKRVAILGSTGSVGRSALDVIRRFPDKFRVTALLAGSNTELLNKQIKTFRPAYAGIYQEKRVKDVRLKRSRIFAGEDAFTRIPALKEVDVVLFAIPGFKGYRALFSALENKKTVALANKEITVSFGQIIRDRQKKYGSPIIPVDSEHSAIFQGISGVQRQDIKNIYLTCSGGALYHVSREEFRNVSVKKVLKHPRWKMGKKITVDSASLINKGLEVIEAHVLFDVPMEKIKILVHPEAIVHGMVELVDSTIIAVAGITDMRLPVLYALSFPERLEAGFLKIDLARIGKLTFKNPEIKKFPGLKLVLDVARKGLTYPCVFNAANEICVEEFIRGRIRFVDIPPVIKKVVDKHVPLDRPDLDDIINTDSWARGQTQAIIERIRSS